MKERDLCGGVERTTLERISEQQGIRMRMAFNLI
jgi:hypothetical protein